MKDKKGLTSIVTIWAIIFLWLAFCWFAWDAFHPRAEAKDILSPDYLYLANLERVIDGDTIVVDLYLGLEVVLDDQILRLYGIDAWEMRGIEREKGLLAKEFLTRLLEHGGIIVEIKLEWGSHGRGKYGRWLAVIYVAGVNINELMVSQGHAEKDLERSAIIANLS